MKHVPDVPSCRGAWQCASTATHRPAHGDAPRRGAGKMGRIGAFTLVELLLVIALVSIVAGIGITATYQDMARAARARAVAAVAADFTYARSLALRDLGTWAGVVVTAGSNRYNCASQTRFVEAALRFDTNRTVTFDASGTPSWAGVLTLSDSIGPAGRIEIVDTTGIVRWTALR